MAEPGTTEGQADTGLEGATGDATGGNEGQSVSSQTTDAGTGEETFFDPKSIEGKPELQSAYKQMQSAWTKKMQSVSSQKEKLQIVERFEKDPIGTLTAFAKQYGLDLSRPNNQQQPQKFEPQSWDDVLKKAREDAKADVLKELQPYLSQIRDVRKQSIETRLNELDPQWRTYEDEMSEMLQAHPSLVSDPEKLYRLSVPQEVIEKRAMQKALAQLKGKQEGGQLSGGSKTFKNPSEKPTGKLSFDQAADLARAELRKQGIGPH